MTRRHAHIYGIDLASPRELVAHNRDRHDIAVHIGADAVIYQTLDNLKAACAELSPRDPSTQRFEVGLFCGMYVTPVDEGYFEHLERVRGEAQKFKVTESAQEAIAVNRISAVGHQEIDAAFDGEAAAEAAENGVVSDGRQKRPRADDYAATNGTSAKRTDGKNSGMLEEEEPRPVRERMDISLHNFGDYSAPDYER